MEVRPHPTLTRYYSDDTARQGRVRQVFDHSAAYYDRINTVLSLGTDKWYRREAVARAGLADGMTVLDVGCGTGLVACFAAELVGPSGCVVGVDPSIGMLRQAVGHGRLKLAALGMAETLPFPDDCFDRVIMSYALRHVSDLTAAFAEYRRVLKPGGRVLLLELTLPPAGVAYGMFKFWMKYMIPTIAQMTTGSREARTLYAYCWDTFDQSVPPSSVLAAMRHVGFQDVDRHVELRVFSEYGGIK